MQYIFRSEVRPRMAYDYGNPDFPVWNILDVADAPASGVNLPEDWYQFRRLNDRYEYSEEKENSFRIDLTREQNFLGDMGDISFGLRARQREKLFDEERYRNGEKDDFNALGIGYPDMLCDSWSNNFDYFLTGRRFCRDIFSNHAGPLVGSDNHGRLVEDSVTADYTASEDVYAVRQDVTRPENGDKGSVYGLELAWQQTFDMLPGAWNGLGVYANYTWAKSKAELPFGLGETELPGTSRHNYNLALTYEKSGFNARLAWNHRSEFIQEFNISNPDLNILWDGRPSLDFTTSYRFDNGISIFGEINNINDTRQVRYQGQRNRVLEMEGFGRSWLAGVRYDF